MSFKVGDKVKRITGQHGGMKPGDVGTVKKVSYDQVELHEFGVFMHVTKNLIKVSSGYHKMKQSLKL